MLDTTWVVSFFGMNPSFSSEMVSGDSGAVKVEAAMDTLEHEMFRVALEERNKENKQYRGLRRQFDLFERMESPVNPGRFSPPGTRKQESPTDH